jgi:hypothetical protein
MLSWIKSKFRTLGGKNEPLATVATDGKTMAGQHVKVAYGRVYGLVGDPAIFDAAIGWSFTAKDKPSGDWTLVSVGKNTKIVVIEDGGGPTPTTSAGDTVACGLVIETFPATAQPVEIVQKAVDNGGLKVDKITVIDIGFALGAD